MLKNLAQSIINALQETAIVSVRALKAHTYSAKVTNFPAFPKEMKVSNQQEVSGEIKKTNKSLLSITALLRRMKFPTEIKVSNFPAFPKFPEFPKEIKVSNFPKFPAFPKSFRVDNQLDLSEVQETLEDIEGAVKGLKLDPKIEVATPAPVVVPPANVIVTQKEVNPEKLAQAIADVIPGIDYKKLGDAIAEELSHVTLVGGGRGGGNSFRTKDGHAGRALVDDKGRVIMSPDYFLSDKATVGSATYTGNLALDGRWYMFRLQGNEIRYASSSNNPNIKYTDAWGDKENLAYDYADHVDF